MIYHYNIIKAVKQYVIDCNASLKDPKDLSFSDFLEGIDDIQLKIKKNLKSESGAFNPNLPIDLISYFPYKDKDDETEEIKTYYDYVLYIVISIDFPFSSIRDKILFYKTYLSRIISTIDLKFIIVLSDRIDNNKEIIDPIDNFTINEWLDNYGIGLFTFDKNLTIYNKKSPLSLRKLMETDFSKESPENSFKFFDKYIQNTIDSIVGIKPENIGKSYIDRKVIDEVFKINRITYKDDLFKLLNLHLTEKGNELEFAEKVFNSLWSKYLGWEYKEILKKFDPSLQNIFYGYRDHYLHQLQVFLVGLPIVDRFYTDIEKTYSNPDLCWLIASSFHDIAYPVQLYDQLGEQFFKSVFSIKKNPALCEFRSNFVDEGFLVCIGHIINGLCEKLLDRPLKANWLETEKDLIKLFYELITKDKNHGVMSSISLLKLLEKESKNAKQKARFKKIVIPASLSIALHDYYVWSEIFSTKANKKSDVIIHTSISFENDPITFLLIYCDNIQEWARPSKSKEFENEKKVFYLKEFKNEDDEVKVTLWTPLYTKSQPFFKKKQKELQLLQDLLKQPPNTKFSIRLDDSKENGESFNMAGI